MSKLLWPSISNACESEGREGFEKHIPIFMKADDTDEHIAYGVVYQPDVEDSQGDMASEEEIRKAAYQFMEEVQVFKVMHKGSKANIKVLESYIAPQDLTITKQKVKKGSWVIAVRVLSDKIWKAIKDGTLTGFSMAGSAKREEA